MLHQTTLLLLVIGQFTLGGDQPKKEPADPSRLRGEVVDVFEGGKLLLSVGKEHGARPGLVGTLNRSDSVVTSIVFGPKFTFVEVGANHSVVQINWPISLLMARNDRTAFETPYKAGDQLVWRPWVPIDLQMHNLRLTPIPEYRPLPFFGGALIDATSPNARKLLPREK